MTKYNLRIDQSGVLEREIMLLLMGVENPNEFTQALVEEAKLDQQTVNNIVQDINDQIFIPLRKEEEKGIESERGQTSFNSSSAPLPPKTVLPARPVTTLGAVVHPILPTLVPAASINVLKNNEEPHLEFQPPTPLLAASAPTNLPGQMPGPELEFRRVESQTQPTAPRPMSPVPVAPAQPKLASLPITSYSADPYREPFDEPLSEM
jgi:hypothetical protein